MNTFHLLYLCPDSASPYLLESLVGEFVLVAHVHLGQQRAVCGQGRQGHVPQLLAAVCGVFLQAGTVRGQRGHTVVMDPPAIWYVDLCHVLPPRGDLYQEIIVHLGHRDTEFCLITETDSLSTLPKITRQCLNCLNFCVCLLVVGHWGRFASRTGSPSRDPSSTYTPERHTDSAPSPSSGWTPETRQSKTKCFKRNPLSTNIPSVEKGIQLEFRCCGLVKKK